MDALIRTLTQADFDFAVAQTSREGWDATAELFETCVAHDPDGCFVAEVAGRPAAIVTATCYDRTGWIGNLVVSPEHRKHGIGGRLMDRAMAYLSGRGVRTLRLEADAPGVKLYRRLGFVDEFESLRFARQPAPSPRVGEVERITPNDLPALSDFDAEHFGDQRGRLLSLLLRHSRQTYCIRTSDSVNAYAMVLPSRFGVRIGPFVAVSAEVADALLRAIVAEWSATTIGIGVSAANGQAISLLEASAFQRTPSSFRMVLGHPIGRGHPEHVYAIAGGALG